MGEVGSLPTAAHLGVMMNPMYVIENTVKSEENPHQAIRDRMVDLYVQDLQAGDIVTFNDGGRWEIVKRIRKTQELEVVNKNPVYFIELESGKTMRRAANVPVDKFEVR